MRRNEVRFNLSRFFQNTTRVKVLPKKITRDSMKIMPWITTTLVSGIIELKSNRGICQHLITAHRMCGRLSKECTLYVMKSKKKKRRNKVDIIVRTPGSSQWLFIEEMLIEPFRKRISLYKKVIKNLSFLCKRGTQDF